MMRWIAILFFLLSCRHAAEEASSSKWAHFPADRSMSVINARLQYLESAFVNDFPAIKVCVQDSLNFQGNDLLLDTKLAYAAWLDASGQGSEAIWKHFQFSVQDRCTMTDNKFSSVVVIGSEPEISPDQEVEKSFRRAKVECTRRGNSVSCSTGTMTMGLGSAGSIGYRFFKPEKWESVSNRLPATVILNPYVEWSSLRGAVEGLKDFALKKELTDQYRTMAAGANAVSYDDLVSFHKKLQQGEVKGGPDVDFERVMQEFLAGKAPTLSQNYTPRLVAFHVLMHEVGHQFGMDHADNPALDSETGFTEKAELQNGQWVTKLATMAYADSYFYLTADDSAGVKDMADKVTAFVKAKKGN